jgi:hypothetical protein
MLCNAATGEFVYVLSRIQCMYASVVHDTFTNLHFDYFEFHCGKAPHTSTWPLDAVRVIAILQVTITEGHAVVAVAAIAGVPSDHRLRRWRCLYRWRWLHLLSCEIPGRSQQLNLALNVAECITKPLIVNIRRTLGIEAVQCAQ